MGRTDYQLKYLKKFPLKLEGALSASTSVYNILYVKSSTLCTFYFIFFHVN